MARKKMRFTVTWTEDGKPKRQSYDNIEQAWDQFIWLALDDTYPIMLSDNEYDVEVGG